MNSENSYNYAFYSKLRDLPSFTPVVLLHDLYNSGSHVLVLVCMHQCIWLCSGVSGNHLAYKAHYMNNETITNCVFCSKLRDLTSFTSVMLFHGLYNSVSCVSVLLCMYQCFRSGMIVHGNNSSIKGLLLHILCFAYYINHLLHTETFKLSLHVDFYLYSWYEKRYA